jgi:hypothetical protein
MSVPAVSQGGKESKLAKNRGADQRPPWRSRGLMSLLELASNFTILDIEEGGSSFLRYWITHGPGRFRNRPGQESREPTSWKTSILSHPQYHPCVLIVRLDRRW